jgi:hypothetical protein
MKIANIISTAVNKGILIIKVLSLGSRDINTLLNVQPYGIDSNPVKELKCVFAKTIGTEKLFLGIIRKDTKAQTGQTRVYSEDVEVWLRNGKLELGGNNNFAVKYTELKQGYDQLVQQVNALITAYNAHTHPVNALPSPTPITSAVTASQGTNITADISACKNENILTN